jgi:D-alanyl-D-alanine carboxypeptidase
MTYRGPARRTTRRIRLRRLRVAGLFAVFAAIAAALGYQSLASSSSTPPPSTVVSPTDVARGDPGRPRRERRGLGSDIPGAADLDPDLHRALRQAAADAADDGVEFVVDSGRRSPEYQQQLLDDAVSKYGSIEEASRWVATPETSAHVSGDAVDIGPSAAAAWLSAHGAEYGLCQIYGNEPWHYELRPEAIDLGCPPMYPDPTFDPRMQQ